MTGTAETQSVTLTRDIPHPPAKVWRALTEPGLLGQWLMETDMEPSVGHDFTFKQEPTPWWDGVVRCEIQELEPNERLRYSWRSATGESQLDTVVTWTLEPTSTGGTRLTLEHSGFVPSDRFAFEGAKEGWERMLDEGLPGVLDQIA